MKWGSRISSDTPCSSVPELRRPGFINKICEYASEVRDKKKSPFPWKIIAETLAKQKRHAVTEQNNCTSI